jgi:predicted O-methyltransferase YrrM
MALLDRLWWGLRKPVDYARSINSKADAIIKGLDNQSQLLNGKLGAVIAGLDGQSRLLNAKLNVLIDESRALNAKLDAVIAVLGGQPVNRPAGLAAPAELPPLLVAEKTYNTAHPEYDAALVSNFPNKILGADLPCNNRIYAELKGLAKGETVPEEAWEARLQEALAEAKTVPHADLVLHRRDALDQYLADIGRRYNARYLAGWVNLDVALFLYWLVRRLKPRTIVQCGVCNGLSSAFMMLALAKNGPEGQLHAIDLPPVFNAKEPGWTVAGRVYGFVIPEGKTSGWMVPEAYRTRFEVQNGDSKALLPPLIDRLPAIDMFYHDSDHTYGHMMFEFHEARRKLAPGGLIVADDISWNAALWEFANEQSAPAFNFKGKSGVVFL